MAIVLKSPVQLGDMGIYDKQCLIQRRIVTISERISILFNEKNTKTLKTVSTTNIFIVGQTPSLNQLLFTQ